MALVGGKSIIFVASGFLCVGTMTYGFWGRRCYTWKHELCDPSTQFYPSLVPADVEGKVRRVGDRENPNVSIKENPGVCIREKKISTDEEGMLMNEVRKWVQTWGQYYLPEKVDIFTKELKEAGVQDTDFITDMQFVSDHHEDTRPSKISWGLGDKMKKEELPPVLRQLGRRCQTVFPYIGELRHIYIEYSPEGKWFRRPKTPHGFDGHDYVVIPLLRQERDMIGTISPILRSRHSDGAEVAWESWTNRDIDFLLPNRSMVRIYGMARHRWGLGFRPYAWFGLPEARIPDYAFQDPDQAEEAWKKVPTWKKLLTFESGKPKKSRKDLKQTEKDEAIIYLHFEGPNSASTTRTRWLKPEGMAYGKPATAATYDVWQEELPSEAMIEGEGVVKWVWKHYFEFIRHS